jgi:Na+-driven multidrug efflux pump
LDVDIDLLLLIFFSMPLFCVFVVCVPGTLVFLFFREQLIHAFTTDEAVIAQLEGLWWLIVVVQSVAGLIGPAEGFVTASKYFK